MADVSKLPRVVVATIDRLTYADIGTIREETGVGLHDPDVPIEKKMAAAEWIARKEAGQTVTFEDVYTTGTIAGVDVEDDEEEGEGVDPTPTLTGT